MKEVMAFIRLNKIKPTKDALADVGFPYYTCRKCLGRGKKPVDQSSFRPVFETSTDSLSSTPDSCLELTRLIPKRFFTLIVEDEDVQLVINTIISANQTGNAGDGKIFVLPIMESYRVRNGVKQTHQ